MGSGIVQLTDLPGGPASLGTGPVTGPRSNLDYEENDSRVTPQITCIGWIKIGCLAPEADA